MNAIFWGTGVIYFWFFAVPVLNILTLALPKQKKEK